MNIPSFDTSIDHEEPSKSDLIPCIYNLWNGKQQMSVSYSFTTNQRLQNAHRLVSIHAKQPLNNRLNTACKRDVQQQIVVMMAF